MGGCEQGRTAQEAVTNRQNPVVGERRCAYKGVWEVWGCQKPKTKNIELYTDFALLDPQNFDDHDSRATPEALQAELLSLATHWDRLKMSVCEEYLIKMGTEDEDDEQTPDDE